MTGAVIALLGRRFWAPRGDITLLSLGTLQAIFGFLIYLERHHIG